MSPPDRDLGQRVRENPLWYHTIDLAPGVTTPGWFDLRPIVDRMPWPDVAGKRCLDVGTYDGFLAFELERRGAAEVVATDVSEHTEWDWPPDARAKGPEWLRDAAGPQKGIGFEIARDALGSGVEKREISIYDLDPGELGQFDVVVLGSLLLHLRDPVRALEAVRSVCGGVLLSADEIDFLLTLRHPRQPVARFNGSGSLCQWWVPNAVAHRRLLWSGGFEVTETARPYAIPFGVGNAGSWASSLRGRAIAALERMVLGGVGVPTSAALARPRL